MEIYREKPKFVEGFIWGEDEETPEWFTDSMKYKYKNALFPHAVVYRAITNDGSRNPVYIVSQEMFFRHYTIEQEIEEMRSNAVTGFVQVETVNGLDICINVNLIKMFGKKSKDDCFIQFTDNSHMDANMSFNEFKHALQLAGGNIA